MAARSRPTNNSVDSKRWAYMKDRYCTYELLEDILQISREDAQNLMEGVKKTMDSLNLLGSTEETIGDVNTTRALPQFARLKDSFMFRFPAIEAWFDGVLWRGRKRLLVDLAQWDDEISLPKGFDFASEQLWEAVWKQVLNAVNRAVKREQTAKKAQDKISPRCKESQSRPYSQSDPSSPNIAASEGTSSLDSGEEIAEGHRVASGKRHRVVKNGINEAETTGVEPLTADDTMEPKARPGLTNDVNLASIEDAQMQDVVGLQAFEQAERTRKRKRTDPENSYEEGYYTHELRLDADQVQKASIEQTCNKYFLVSPLQDDGKTVANDAHHVKIRISDCVVVDHGVVEGRLKDCVQLDKLVRMLAKKTNRGHLEVNLAWIDKGVHIDAEEIEDQEDFARSFVRRFWACEQGGTIQYYLLN